MPEDHKRHLCTRINKEVYTHYEQGNLCNSCQIYSKEWDACRLFPHPGSCYIVSQEKQRKKKVALSQSSSTPNSSFPTLEQIETADEFFEKHRVLDSPQLTPQKNYRICPHH